MTTTPTTQPISLDADHAADLTDLLRCLSSWIDAEHHQLEPLLDRHDYDIYQLRATLDHYAALIDPSEKQF